MNLWTLSIVAFRPSSLRLHVVKCPHQTDQSKNLSCVLLPDASRKYLYSTITSLSMSKRKTDTISTSHERRKRKKQSRSTTSDAESTSNFKDTSQDWFHTFTQNDRLYHQYMTEEWAHEKYYQTDNELFEKLSLEGAQSGLSWRTILHKREAYRKAFHQFDIDRVASMTKSDIDNILVRTSDDPTELVVRHRGKLESVVHNAKTIQSLKANGTIPSFKQYLWSFVNHKPILNTWKSFQHIPSTTPESEAMSKDLKKKGFKYVGPTTLYAFMQSCGFVIDHPIGTPGWIAAEERLKARKGGYRRR